MFLYNSIILNDGFPAVLLEPSIRVALVGPRHLLYVFYECGFFVVVAGIFAICWILCACVRSLLAEVKEVLAFLRVKLDKLIRYVFQASVNEVKILQAGQVLSQVLRWMPHEQLLHLKQDVKGSDQVWVFRVQGLADPGYASHYHSYIMPFLNGKIHGEVVGHGFALEQPQQTN